MASSALLPAALLFVFVYCGLVFSQSQGPALTLEPPRRLAFSSTAGARADCLARGVPHPSITWLMHDDVQVSNVPGLRIVMDNGSLVFPAFPAHEFRQDVHAAAYRCRVANQEGVVLSRDVYVTAVIAEDYTPRVLGAHASLGGPAVLTCDKREHVTVTSWFRDDSIILPGPPDPGSRFVMTSRGELLIRAAQHEDSQAGFSCSALNTLTGERKRSAATGITITESPSGMAPRMLTTTTEVTQESGRDMHLLCSALGNPTPTYSWFRDSGGHLYPVVSSARITVSHDVVFIRRAEPSDSGVWACLARNQYGEQRHRTPVTVTAPLAVHVQPQSLVANTGTTAVLNCTLSGGPVARVRWLHDGLEVPARAGTSTSTSTSTSTGALKQLVIERVTRADKGMYQCVAVGTDALAAAQGTAELRLGDMAPELQYTFIEQALRGGPPVSLRCSAAGTPPPRFQWLLDGQPLAEITSSHRFTTGQYVTKNGDVVGHLNISSVRTEDGGLYSCMAKNTLGETSHTARLNIYGPPSIRAVGPIRAVAGSNTTLHCPYSGYPISSVRWSRRGQELAGTPRLGPGSQGALNIARVDPVADAGGYTCTVVGPDGEIAKRDLQVVVKNPPKLVPFSFPTDLEEGSSVQLLCGMTSGDRPVYFSWLKDGNVIPSSLQIQEKSLDEFSFLIFSDVSSKHSGDYTCVASNMAAKVNYTAQLMVKVSPRWIYEPQDVATLLGTPIIIHCSARGFPEPKITWAKGQGPNIQDYRPLVDFDSRQMILDNGTLMILSAHPYNEGQYLCKAENGIGPGLSKVIFLTVNEPARFEIATKNISARRNDPVTLVCEVFGDNPIKVQWTHNMKRIDLNTYSLSMSEVRTETGLRSQLVISRAERRDSGAYRCQAENNFGRSEHIIHLAVEEKPDPPLSLQVVEVGSRIVKLSWIKGFDGNTPLLGYLVQHQLLGSVNKDDWVSAKVINITLDNVKISHNNEDLERHGGVVGLSDAIVCEALVSGLHPATAYTVRLASYNLIEQSTYSDPVVVKTQEEAPAEAPLSVQVQVGGQGELIVSWKAPPHESWNGDLLGYLVTWHELNQNSPFPVFNSNSSKSMTVNGWSNLEVTLTGLKKFTRYGITVQAFNGVSAGPSSAPVSAITQEGVPEAPPSNIVCSPLSSQSIKVSWEAPPVALHGGLLMGYKIIYKPTGSQDSMVSVTGETKRTSSAETYLHGLKRYTNYSVQVLAYTASGDGKRSAPLHCLTKEDLPGPPSSVKANALTADSILVSWLPPIMKNGRISHYTVYSREAGRVGKHSTTAVSADGIGSTSNSAGIQGPGGCLTTEIRGLVDNRLYEFWISAATSTGEGEPTAIIAQITTSRAPARIASFSKTLQQPLKSSVMLSCLAVGNPSPRTLWMHRGRPVTHSEHYRVTQQGHLDIHSMESTLSGNYTCTAKNLFGEDTITYSITALLPPEAPQMRLQSATSSFLKFQWLPVNDGGSPVQTYNLHFSREGHPWEVITLPGDDRSYTLDGLACGSSYIIYMEAQNVVDKGSPSQKLRATTKGGVSKVPNEKDLVSSNSSSLKLNLLAWDNGGCPIIEFVIEYRSFSELTWMVERCGLKTEGLVVNNLRPASWYYLKVTAVNEAGSTTGKFYFSTLTPEGVRIASPATFPPHWDSPDHSSSEVFGRLSAILAGVALLAFLSLIALLLILFRNKRSSFLSCPFKGYSRGDISEDEKSVENQDNRRNCQQVYTSSPIKHPNGKCEQPAEMYEISPYATFSMGGGATGAGGRSLTASTLDYTVQFRTFGRSEGEALGPAPARPNLLGHDRRSTKHRSFSSSDEYTLSKAMTMAASGSGGAGRCRAPRPGAAAPSSHNQDSESDSSGSPCTECNSNPSYRLPINTPKDMFRPVADSSAESQSEMSPGGLGGPVTALGGAMPGLVGPMGGGGAPSHRTPRRAAYHTGGRGHNQRQEQERREFTIHV